MNHNIFNQSSSPDLERSVQKQYFKQKFYTNAILKILPSFKQMRIEMYAAY